MHDLINVMHKCRPPNRGHIGGEIAAANDGFVGKGDFGVPARFLGKLDGLLRSL